MIRRPAAEKLAHAILTAIAPSLLPQSLEMLTHCIERAVAADEDQQLVEALKAKMAVDKVVDAAIKGAGK